MKHLFFSCVLSFVTYLTAFSQNQLLTIQDAVLKGRTALAPKRLQNIGFIPQSKKMAYIEKNDIKVLSAETGKELSSISTIDINKALLLVSKDSISAIENLRWENENAFYFTSKKTEWLYALDKKTVSKSDKKRDDATLENLDAFNEGEIFAYTKEDNNLFVTANGQTNQVTKDGSYEMVNGKSVHRDEFGISKGTFWSPNGNYLAFYKMDQTDVTDYPIIDWSTYPAQNKNIKYPMAGNKSHYVRP
jgi:dipeptidyl-peptidase 4